MVCVDDLFCVLLEWDCLCDEIGEVLGEELMDCWLMIMFMMDWEWVI